MLVQKKAWLEWVNNSCNKTKQKKYWLSKFNIYQIEWTKSKVWYALRQNLTFIDSNECIVYQFLMWSIHWSRLPGRKVNNYIVILGTKFIWTTLMIYKYWFWRSRLIHYLFSLNLHIYKIVFTCNLYKMVLDQFW